MKKKTFEISNIQSVEELNHLSLKLNEKEQVSHIKVNKDSIVFHCLDIDTLLSLIQSINKELVVKEVVDGKKREYDFAKRKERQYYFMFKNMLTEDDIYVLVERIEQDRRYQNVRYDAQNKLLLLTSSQRDVLSLLRKELFKINPSVEIIEHHRPIRSQDVFNQKFLHMYMRIGILLVVIALALVTSKDDTIITPILWFVTVVLLGTSLLQKGWGDILSKKYFGESLLVFIAMIFGVVSGAYIETCVALIIYELSTPLLNKVLERSLHKIDNAVEMPETGIRYRDELEEKVSLYDVEIGDILIVKPGETVSIPGIVDKGVSAMSTYSNTSTYEPVVVKKGSHVSSGDVNVGESELYIQVDETYESSNYMNLMNIASIAPVYESKVEKYTKNLAKFYTPVMIVLGLLLGFVLPMIDFEEYSSFIHVGAVFLVISGALSSDQATSLGMLAGFAKAFQNGIIVESSLGLDSVNAAQTIVYDRFDGVEVTNEELSLFKKLSHMGRSLVIYNDGPVALEDDQYKIYNDLTNEEKLATMDSLTGPVVYIGDTFKDIELLQKSYVGISRGGLADPKVVENSDIVLIDADLNRVYETFVIARKMRTIAVANNILTVVIKIAMLVTALSWTMVPLWAIVLIEILLKAFVIRNSTCIL
ncbi:hypothetical protein NMU03_16500 [Allocoprobacillus halotolerans]|uniref:P-type ATPase A domain-containing protein n=1 Tax=Allocoprobacillus halotolerans TaxID=2944914 RepID=A0ABY5I1F5_9FIRM|nr:hypothetical protein [Allocoprobacillus halotolerans]UTY39144.1 hypothetical protein NMU03_16500 [Allocoprobacillus halotolerans]